jgi:signal transduction histidine kinase
MGVSAASLWLMYHLREDAIGHGTRRLAASVAMGIAISGMHYTGMAAVSFTGSGAPPDFSQSVPVSWLGVSAIVSIGVVALVAAGAMAAFDRLRKVRASLRALTRRVESLREEERTRIAREVHDDLGQRLTALRMEVLWLERKLGELERLPTVRPILERAVEATALIEELIRAVQEVGAELRPGVLDQLGLGAALEYEGRRFQERSGIACEVMVPAAVRELPPEHATALFRIFQECLTNVVRHAGATKVTVTLKQEAGWTVLVVHDDGRGIGDEEVASPGSLGLVGIRERAALLGGEAAFERNPAGGTTVTVRLPLPRIPAQPSIT